MAVFQVGNGETTVLETVCIKSDIHAFQQTFVIFNKRYVIYIDSGVNL